MNRLAAIMALTLLASIASAANEEATDHGFDGYDVNIVGDNLTGADVNEALAGLDPDQFCRLVSDAGLKRVNGVRIKNCGGVK